MAHHHSLAGTAEPSTGSSLSQAQNEDDYQRQHDSDLSPPDNSPLVHDSVPHARSHSHSHSHFHHSRSNPARHRSAHSHSSPDSPGDKDSDDSSAKVLDGSDRPDLSNDPNSVHEAAADVLEEVRILLEKRQVNPDADETEPVIIRVVQTVSLVQHVDQAGNPIRAETLYPPPSTEVVDPESGNTVVISALGSLGTPVPVPGTDPAPGGTNNVPLPPYPTNVPPPADPPAPTPIGTPEDVIPLPVPELPEAPEPPLPPTPPEAPSPPSPPEAPEAPETSEELEEPVVTLDPANPIVTPIPPPITAITPPSLNATSTALSGNSTTVLVASISESSSSSSSSSPASTFERSTNEYSYTSTPSTYSFTTSADWSRSSSYSDSSDDWSSFLSYSTDTSSPTDASSDEFGDYTSGGTEPTESSSLTRGGNDEPEPEPTDGSLSPKDRRIVGGVVGGVAGAAFFLILVLLALKYKRRRGDITEIIGDRGASPRAIVGAPAGPVGPDNGGTGGEMAERGSSFAVPAALAALTAKKSTPPASPVRSGERGFVRVSGRKLPSVLQHGGDGFTDPRESVMSGHSDYFRGSQEFVPGAAASSSRPPRLALGSPMRPVSGVPIMRSGPARTPVALENPFADPFSDPPSPPILPPPRDPLGRSRGSQDGSRGSSSRFHEAI